MSGSRLSTLDASFLEVESSSAHMHVGWAARFAKPQARSAPRFEDLRDHVAGRMGRAPRYRQKLAQVPLSVHDPVWIDDAAFAVEDHVRRGGSRDLGELADEVMSTPLDRDRPLWELWIADDLPDGGIGVIGKAHHAMVDGLAAVELATLLVDPTPEPSSPEPNGWRPAQAPDEAKLLLDAITDRAGEVLTLARWPLELTLHPRRLAELASGALPSARALADALRASAPQTCLNEPISPGRHLACARRPLSDLREIKARFATTVNDVLLAATSGAVRRLFHARGETPVRLKTMVPVSVRGNNGSGSLGNQISFVFVDLPCEEPDPRRRLIDVHQQMGKRKRGGQPEGADRVLKALGYAPRTIQHAFSHLAASPRAFNLTVSNIPGPSQSLYMLGCELEEVYPVVPIADRHALSIGMTTVGDQAFFGVYAACEAMPDADLLAELLDHSVEELLALEG
ncbi:MAG TPA: wax ester/triacylglycerol synthase family O-acyltransferase [Thermoleophilaceae bacterium]|nr:wax ester/triacylglycerol synthase family O-acyltransferase [Thermoleophilaceae bacterium]